MTKKTTLWLWSPYPMVVGDTWRVSYSLHKPRDRADCDDVYVGNYAEKLFGKRLAKRALKAKEPFQVEVTFQIRREDESRDN